MSERIPLDSPSSDPLDIPSGYTPRQSADVLALDMGDGLVLFNRGSSVVHHLNPSAALVWHLCNGTGTVVELSADIAAEYGREPAGVESEVKHLVAEFEALGLVEDATERAG